MHHKQINEMQSLVEINISKMDVINHIKMYVINVHAILTSVTSLQVKVQIHNNLNNFNNH
jgi:hypothetical protein